MRIYNKGIRSRRETVRDFFPIVLTTTDPTEELFCRCNADEIKQWGTEQFGAFTHNWCIYIGGEYSRLLKRRHPRTRAYFKTEDAALMFYLKYAGAK